MVRNMVCEPVDAALGALLRIRPGTTINGGDSLPFYLYLKPFFALLGASLLTLNIASMVLHLLFAALLWLLVRRFAPKRSPVAFGLVFFVSPWYRATIFSNTHNGFSLFLVLGALLLFFQALRSTKSILYLAAGFALGLNFYGYAVARLYPFLCVFLLLLIIFADRHRGRNPRVRVGHAIVLIAALILSLGTNLAQPRKISHQLFWDPEAVNLMHYKQIQELRKEKGSEPLSGSKNLGDFFRAYPMRHHTPFFDRFIFILFLFGAAVVFRRKDPLGGAFLFRRPDSRPVPVDKFLGPLAHGCRVPALPYGVLHRVGFGGSLSRSLEKKGILPSGFCASGRSAFCGAGDRPQPGLPATIDG